MFEWKGLRTTVRFTGAHKQYLLRKIRLHIVRVCFYIIAWKMVSFIQLYIHRRSMFEGVDAKRNCPRMLKFSTRYAQSNTCQLSFWQSKSVHNVSSPNTLKNIDIHVLCVARKWVIHCVQKLACAFIYERLLESLIFRTQVSLVLTVCANRKESSPRSLTQAVQYVVMKF